MAIGFLFPEKLEANGYEISRNSLGSHLYSIRKSSSYIGEVRVHIDTVKCTISDKSCVKPYGVSISIVHGDGREIPIEFLKAVFMAAVT